MQPLVKAMPEVMRVSSLLNTGRRSTLAGSDGAGIPHPPGRLCRDPRPAGGRGGRADCPRLVECGCGNATGWVQVLPIPGWQKRSMPCISARGQLESGRSGAGGGAFTLAVRGTFLARDRHHPRPLSDRAAYAAGGAVHHPRRPGAGKRSPSASGINRWRPSAGPSNASPAIRRGPARHSTLDSAFM